VKERTRGREGEGERSGIREGGGRRRGRAREAKASQMLASARRWSVFKTKEETYIRKQDANRLSLSRDRRLFAHFYLFFEQAKKRPRNQFGVHGAHGSVRRERRRGIFHSREAELAALLLSDERVREYSANARIDRLAMGHR